VNYLGFDIEYKQYNNKISKEENDKNTLSEKNILKNNESIKLNTLKANKNMKKIKKKIFHFWIIITIK
jgi:hypothetical protein